MPTRDTAWPAGTPCWIDYGAADLDAAKAFYTDLLGWSYSGGAPEYGGYLTGMRGDHAAAGMAPQQDPSDPPRWTTYFASDDAHATAERITAAGGTLVVPPMEVGPMGTMVIARDPEGHPFGVWQAGQQTGCGIYNEPGSLVWNEAAVEDVAAAQAFYSAVFGFRVDPLEMAGPDYGTFALPHEQTPLGGLGGLMGAPEGTPSHWLVYFGVEDADAAAAAASAGGGSVTTVPFDSPFGRMAGLADPDGAAFWVAQALPDAPQPDRSG